MDHLVPQVSKDTKRDVWFLEQDIWREEHKSEDGFVKIVEECEDPEWRTTWSGRRRSGECRSGDNHIEWPPNIMGFIHSKNVCKKEVIILVDSKKKKNLDS